MSAAPSDIARSRARAGAVVGLAALASFQLALALGAPWGAAAWGGAHPGVLPDELRRASGAAAPMYAGLVVFVLSDVGGRWRGRVLVVFAVLFALGAVLNYASPSWIERLVWDPIAALLSWSFGRLRPREPSR